MQGKKVAIAMGAVAVGVLALGGAYTFMGGGSKTQKILVIDSYHEGYEWSDGVVSGVRQVLGPTKVEFTIHRMDTKRNTSDDFKTEAGLKAKALVEEIQPDVIIASDDNAQKYLVVPYLRDGDTPIVFAGVNWDASVYGYPTPNVTGMVEVSRPDQLLDILRTLSGGFTTAFLADDSETSRKELKYYVEKMGIAFDQVVFVSEFEDWKREYRRLQTDVDMLFFYNYITIEGWDEQEAARFVRENSEIPSGALSPWMAPYVMVAYTKNAEEHGEWAAEAALKILQGTKPGNIPVTKNRKGNMVINSAIARHLNIEIPASLLASAADPN